MASQPEKDAVPSRPELGEACPLSEAQRRRLFIDEYEFLLIWHPVAHCSASEASAVRTRLPKRSLFLPLELSAGVPSTCMELGPGRLSR